MTTQLTLIDSAGRTQPVAGRVALRVGVIAEMRRSIHDDELGATLRVQLPDGQQAICVGADVPQRQVGATLHITGYWDYHATRGRVLRVENVHGIERPDETRAVVSYLAANIPGLGRARAKRLVGFLGRDTLAKLLQDPGVARDIFRGGTGESIVMALSSWSAEQARDTVAQRLMTRLTAAGVTYGTIRRIVRFFSTSDAAAVVTMRHPYRLVEVPGIGWKTADGIAQRLGVAEDDPMRSLAACQVVLADAPKRGHTGLPVALLRRRAARLLGCTPNRPTLIAAAENLVTEGHAVSLGALVGLPEAIALEAEIADRIAGLLAVPHTLSAAQELAAEAILSASTLVAAQKEAVWCALRHGCSVLTGRPGAGKTTTLKTLVACAQALGWSVQIVAPTGKAASRAAAVTGMPASTVHRLLAGEPIDAPTALSVHLVIVDEASMCDVETAAWLLRAVSPELGVRIVWCGDADQLPSVGSGQVLSDMIASGTVPTARLTQVFRQSGGSPIVRNAHRLLDGEALDLSEISGWRFVPVLGPMPTAPTAVLAEVQTLLAAGYAPGDIQVLSPMRRGPLGIESLNHALQDLLNPAGALGPYVGGGVRARVGDRVVATRNIYDLPSPLYNGEQGTVVEADRRGVLRLKIDERVLTLTGVHCLMLRLAWAMTVHRSQGSEYPAVVLAYDHRAHQPMLDRRLLYTAITRARQHCSIVGTREALAETAMRESASMRHTSLAWQLASLIPHLGGAV